MREQSNGGSPARWAIPATWSWTVTNGIARIVGGGTPSTTDSKNFDKGEIPWITPADLTGYREKMIRRGARNITEKGLRESGAKVMPAGTVLFSSRAPIGYVAIADNPLATNQGFKSFIPTSAVNSDYLYYYLQFAIPIAREMASGTTFLEISGAKAAQIPIPLAPFREQKEIVDEIEKQFTRLDAATAALKRVQINLKRYRASVLKAACEGRLVPTEAELASKEGRDYEPAGKLLQRILRERRARLEADTLAKMQASGKPPKDNNWKQKYKEPSAPDTSNHPPLPEGWCWANFNQVIWRLRSGSAETSGREVTDYPVLKSSAVRPGKVDLDDLNYLQESQSVNEDNYLQLHDVLVTRLSGSLEYVGVCAIVTTLPSQPIQYPDRIFCGKLVGAMDGVYVSHCFSHPPLRERLEQAAKSTAGHQRISMSDLCPFVFPLPPLSEQRRISVENEKYLSVLEKTQATVQADLKRIDRLRQAILSSAFSGILVPQDPTDEPASLLLERIRTEHVAPASQKPTRRSRKEPAHA